MATRQSSRLKTKAEKDQGDYADEASESSEDEYADDQTPGPSTGAKRKGRAKSTSAKAASGSFSAGKAKASDANDQTRPEKKRRRGNRGALERILDMPYDLLFEIFGKLNPMDLLNLA
ncbi:hypothetical protein CC1G_09140 [Coprinopsis cinerea okayama7|uniref:F-box domain-containing protein n=1 Tax=Coprinopsis cinerea (strain Okayama-7 / 130 / ATCC MYA-4618 / FGSC 9003) TaxID=240176 RepID=A8P9P1_COPC7|nr:hypothetical protein CC1G_09140 [Coprinopsis cinerea okayama7\|eukprot:XP_001839806.1 hypothetical protein CC1G_09140 [Coprinopsis cinerea okayama7\